MAKLSRRKLIAGAAAAPLAGALNGPAHAAPGRVAPRTPPTAKADPVVAKVEAWIAERDAIDAMLEEWADLESALCDKIKPTPMSLTQACRSGLPEARAMRALDRKIKSGLRRLERAAQGIVLMRTSSAEGALAKIRLGVRIQGPYDWNDDYVYALVQDGCEQLALMLSA
ncbi:MAG: hypothetical protein AB7J28_17120 [Hyphomonadaceae bacterium]